MLEPEASINLQKVIQKSKEYLSKNEGKSVRYECQLDVFS